MISRHRDFYVTTRHTLVNGNRVSGIFPHLKNQRIKSTTVVTCATHQVTISTARSRDQAAQTSSCGRSLTLEDADYSSSIARCWLGANNHHPPGPSAEFIPRAHPYFTSLPLRPWTHLSQLHSSRRLRRARLRYTLERSADGIRRLPSSTHLEVDAPSRTERALC